MIIEPEFAPIIVNGGLALKITTLRMVLPLPFPQWKILRNLPYFKDY